MRSGPDLVCGLDEAGRGALAGPVVAAAVVLGIAASAAFGGEANAKVPAANPATGWVAMAIALSVGAGALGAGCCGWSHSS